MIPVSDSPPLSVQLPSPQVPSEGRQHLESSFDEKCAPPQTLRADGAQYEESTWGQLRGQRSQRGFRGEESNAVLTTRLATMEAAEAKRNLLEGAPGDGKRERAPVVEAKGSDNLT